MVWFLAVGLAGASDVSAWLFAGLQEYTDLDSVQTPWQYLHGLRQADEKTFTEQFEAEFRLLLDEKQQAAYDTIATITEKKAFIEHYWKSTNPNPILPQNDWLLDFLRRRAFVRKYFPAFKPPYFDDRGKFYLKYGPPTHRYEYYPELDANRVSRNYTILPNESWSYWNIDRNIVVHFVQQGSVFKEAESLIEAIVIPVGREARAYVWADLVERRAWISPMLEQVQVEILWQVEAQEHASERSLLRKLLMSPVEEIYKLQRDVEWRMDNIREEMPVTAYDPVRAINKLDFYNRIAQFRAPDGGTRVEVALLAPFRENLAGEYWMEAPDTVDVEFRGLLQNEHFEDVAEDAMTTNVPLQVAAATRLSHAVGELVFALAPQQGSLTLQVKNRRKDEIGFLRQEFQVRDFGGDTLQVSDVRFFAEVKDPKQARILPTRTQDGLQLAPYPYMEVKRSTPIVCYFEVYNLQTAGFGQEYEISYTLSRDKTPGNFLKRLFGSGGKSVSVAYQQPVQGNVATETIILDLRQVSPGTHRLEITVTDPRDRTKTVKTWREFKIVD